MRLGAQLLAIILILASVAAHAWVDEANANFALSRVDHRIKGGDVQLVLQRTYNSVSVTEGDFGYGWCSTFETSLTAVSGQQVVVQECGGGRANVFSAQPLDAKAQAEATKEIMKAAKAKLPSLPGDFQQVLERDAIFRAHIVRELQLEFKINDHAKLSAMNGETVTVNGTHLTLAKASGETDVFSQKGWLESVSNGKSQITFGYENDLLKWVTDDKSSRFFIRYDKRHHITEITAPKGGSSKYEYSQTGELLKAKNANGTETYAYDTDHNLIEASTPQTKLQLSYDTSNDRVKELVYGDCRESYAYDVKSGVTDSFKVTRTLSCKGAAPTQATSEYHFASRSDGLTLKSDQIVTTPNERVETRYDDRGRLISRESPKDKTEFKYGSDNRLSSFKTSSASVAYIYGQSGQIQSAKVENGPKISYGFDRDGRLTKMNDDAGHSIVLNYEGASKRAASVQSPGHIRVPLSLAYTRKIPREPASVEEMANTLAIYDQLYTPIVPVMLGGQSAR